MSRLAAALLGKMPTTSVRRLISLFSRSSGLLDQICRQFATGKAVKARMSGPASARSAAARGHAGQAGAVSVDRVDLFEAAFAAEGEGDLGAVGRLDGGMVFGMVIGEVGEAGAIGIHRLPEQVVLLPDDLARVQADADHHLVTRRLAAVVLLERALDADGAGNGPARRAEGDHEAVAQRLHLAAAVLFHLLPHELLVRAQDIPRSLITPARGQAGGALDVREQDGDGAFGQLFGHSAPYPYGAPPSGKPDYSLSAENSQRMLPFRSVTLTPLPESRTIVDVPIGRLRAGLQLGATDGALPIMRPRQSGGREVLRRMRRAFRWRDHVSQLWRRQSQRAEVLQ